MDNKKEVITHLQIIRTWADIALEYSLFFNKKHLESIVKWVDDALELLNKEAL